MLVCLAWPPWLKVKDQILTFRHALRRSCLHLALNFSTLSCFFLLFFLLTCKGKARSLLSEKLWRAQFEQTFPLFLKVGKNLLNVSLSSRLSSRLYGSHCGYHLRWLLVISFCTPDSCPRTLTFRSFANVPVRRSESRLRKYDTYSSPPTSKWITTVVRKSVIYRPRLFVSLMVLSHHLELWQFFNRPLPYAEYRHNPNDKLRVFPFYYGH